VAWKPLDRHHFRLVGFLKQDASQKRATSKCHAGGHAEAHVVVVPQHGRWKHWLRGGCHHGVLLAPAEQWLVADRGSTCPAVSLLQPCSLSRPNVETRLSAPCRRHRCQPRR
jgi:hypothetical protein